MEISHHNCFWLSQYLGSCPPSQNSSVDSTNFSSFAGRKSRKVYWTTEVITTHKEPTVSKINPGNLPDDIILGPGLHGKSGGYKCILTLGM